jgi:hypothetical protein
MTAVFRARCVGLSLLAAAVVLVAGCGGGQKGSKVTVHLVLPAKPKVDPNDAVQVTFVPVSGGELTYPLTGNAGDLKFTSPPKTGIPPGEYKIAVTLTPYQLSGPDREKYHPFNSFFNEKGTPLKVTVGPESEQSFTVTADPAKPSVNKG